MVWDWRPGLLHEPDADAPLSDEERRFRDAIGLPRLKEHVYRLAGPEMEGRDNGTIGSERARDYIVAELEGLGIEPFFDGSWFQEIRRSKHGKPHGTNIAGMIRATAQNPDRTCVMIVGHYDHLGIGPDGIYAGADDNAGAVAAGLEIARAMVETKPKLAHDVVISIPDCEEGPDVRQPTMGSTWMMNHLPDAAGPVRLSIAIDVIGNRSLGSHLLVLGAETCRTTADLVGRVPGEPDAVPIPASVPIIEQAPLFPSPQRRFHKGDYIGAIENGVPFLFVLSGTAPTYHTTLDVPESVDYGKLTAVTRYAAGLLLSAANDTAPLAPFSAAAVDPLADVEGILRAIGYVLSNEPPGLRKRLRERLDADRRLLSEIGANIDTVKYQQVRAAALHLQHALARPHQSLPRVLYHEVRCRIGIRLLRWIGRR